MNQISNPFSHSDSWNLVADGYVETTMFSLSEYSREAINMASLKEDDSIIDVACGPGTLSLMVSDQVTHVTAIDFSENMISHLNKEIQNQKIRNITTHVGDGQTLTFQDNSFDAAFSMFGLMFFPDRIRGFSELHRVLKPGACTVVASWAPIEQSPAMRVMFGTLKEINPDMPEPDKSIVSLDSKEVFEDEMSQSGFNNIDVSLVTKSFPVKTVEEFWDTMVRGSLPIVLYKQTLTPEQWEEKNQQAITFLKQEIGTMQSELTADALIGVARK